jgi:hypothetical protein
MAGMISRPRLDTRLSTSWLRRTLGTSRHDLKVAFGLIRRLVWRHRALLPHVLRALYETMRKNPDAAPCVFSMTLMYLHLGPFARHVASVLDRRLAMLPADEHAIEMLPTRSFEPDLAAAE